jgi:hypothetical protein
MKKLLLDRIQELYKILAVTPRQNLKKQDSLKKLINFNQRLYNYIYETEY